MPHYIVGLMQVTDPSGMDEYVRRVGPTITQYGGEVVFGGEVVGVPEGYLEASTGAVIRFADGEAAMRWFDSPEYTELREFRASLGRASHVLMRAAETGEDH